MQRLGRAWKVLGHAAQRIGQYMPAILLVSSGGEQLIVYYATFVK